MKKVFALVLSLLFLVTISFAVVGCNKADEQKPAAPPKVQAPAPAAPAPAATRTGARSNAFACTGASQGKGARRTCCGTGNSRSR